jgi:amino-acid N-acetyltransferase
MPARTTATDWPAIERLLRSSGLPLDGAEAAFATGVAAHEGGEAVGVAAIEPYDGAAVLRSVAVREDHRGRGLGHELVAAAEDLARAHGASEVVLLTETAEPFFARLGYEVIDRGAVAADVAASIEFSTACPSTAVAMRRRLG